MNKAHLLGLSPERLVEVCTELGAPRYTANQLTHWIYKQNASGFSSMSNISMKIRHALEESYELSRLPCAEIHDSLDGTRKYVFQTDSDRFIETAVIPEEKRATLCVSTQVGCRWNCEFCYTGEMGYRGDLEVHEILGQYAAALEVTPITNIVYMGMGDPMDAIGPTLQSLEAFTGEWGYGISPRKITVSTVGVLPGLERFLNESDGNLALSVHSPFPEIRRKIMPVEARYPLVDVVNTIRRSNVARRRKVSIEYVVFEGLNNSRNDVEALAKLLRGLRCRINLISFNRDEIRALDGAQRSIEVLVPATPERIDEFRLLLLERGFRVTVRKSRGNDIAAACGRLSTRRFSGPRSKTDE